MSNRKEWFWFLSVLLIFSLVGMWANSVFGPIASIAWTVIGLPTGFAMGRFFRRRRRQAMVEEWRAAHPGLSDYWLPSRLRGKV